MEKKPNILLIGAGKFGKQHLRVLKELEKEGRLNLRGVVVEREESKKTIKNEFGIEVYAKQEPLPLESVDAIDIATPASTHYELTKKYIQNANIFAEKPLALSSQHIEEMIKLSEENKKVLMAGHIYRFNNAVIKLKEIIEKDRNNLYSVEAKFTGGIPSKDCGIIHTYMHPLDIMNCLFNENPKSVYCDTLDSSGNKKNIGEYAYIILNYGNTNACIKLEWGKNKERTLRLRFKDYKISCSLITQSVEIIYKDRTKNIINCHKEEPLKTELERFVEVINGADLFYPTAHHALKVQKIIELAEESAKKYNRKII